MYSLSDSPRVVDGILNDRTERLDIEDKENFETCKKQSLVLKNDHSDISSHFDNICEKIGGNKSPIEENRKEILQNCLNEPQFNLKIAETINIDNSENIHVGHVINITEQIVLNGETNELEVDTKKWKDYKDYFYMIDRMHWLAQPSLEKRTYLKRPARYVIICHTATEEAFTQAKNILTLRITQTFHIESQGWADIAYNFCIGSDGNAYEGRGWFVQGSHTHGYNMCSVGIAFIGCFLHHLPPPTSLKRCKELIAHGVQIGAISPDYELIGHCQCRPFLSPGTRLFEEIETWEHFNPNISHTDLCRIND